MFLQMNKVYKLVTTGSGFCFGHYSTKALAEKAKGRLIDVLRSRSVTPVYDREYTIADIELDKDYF